jgi:hypothetical protein
MYEKKNNFLLSVSLFSFLFFIAVGISSAVPIKSNSEKVPEGFISLFPEFPAYNSITAISDFSNFPESNSNETTDVGLNLASDLGSNSGYYPESASDGADETHPVPEPATIILLGSGLIGMLFRKMKRNG